MWWNIIYFDKHNGIVPFFPDFIIRLFVSIFICNFAMSCYDFRLFSNCNTKISEKSDMAKS